MAERPYTLLSCCISLDGYLDGAAERRLILSNPDDLDRVDEVRASCDAILVGAGTIRADNPRLLVRDEPRRAARVERGLPPSPVKVTVTESAKLDPGAAFFACGDAPRLVYCSPDRAEEAREAVGDLATIVELDGPVAMRWLSEDLHARGVRRLMVEGGGTVLTQFLADCLADELQLVVAPFFVGDPRATRFVHAGEFPWCPDRRAELVEARPIGDVALLRYALSPRFGERAGRSAEGVR